MSSHEPIPDEARSRSSRIARLRGNQVARSTGWMLVSQLGQTATQAVYFLLIARSLGVGSYGLFVAAAGLAAAVGPFGTFGQATIVVRNVARAPERVALFWGNALGITAVFGTLLVALFVLTSQLILPGQTTLLLVACVATADLLFANVHLVNSQALLGMSMPRQSAQLPLTMNVSRLAFAGVFVLTGGASPTTWAVLYLVSSGLAAVIGSLYAMRLFGRPRLDRALVRSELRDGAVFALGFSANAVYNDVDKPLVARWAGVEAAGAYAAGYRVVNIALAPVRSLLFATISKFFQHGSAGITATARYARRLVPLAGGMGLVVGVALWLGAPLAPVVFGSGFEDAADTMRLLAIMPFLKAVQNLGGDALTGANRQGTRTVLQATITAINIGLNAWLIPLYSYRGAIIATIVCDVVLLVLLWTALTWYEARARRLIAHGTRAVAVHEAEVATAEFDASQIDPHQSEPFE